MRALPIFRGPPPSPVAEAPALPLDSGCRRCANAGKTPETTCLPADGDPGGLLVVDGFPTRNDAAMRRPLASAAAAQARRLVQQHARGPVAYDAALRCAPTGDTSTLKLAGAVEKCRGYLHQTIREVRPTRIIALGGPAIYALTGKVVPPQTTRRGFAWVPFEHGLVPVFFVISPLAAARSRFLAKWLAEDLEWALTTAVPVGAPEADAQAHLIETTDDARQAVAAVSGARWTAVDAEWAGRPYDADFQLLSVALTPAPRLTSTGAPDLDDPASSSAYVWPSQGCSPEAWRVLAEWLRDPKAKKVGSYFKSDTVAFHAALGVWTRGVAFDTRLLRRLMDVEASGRLADMAHLVGRGGHKDELQESLSKAVGAAKREARKGPGLLPARLPATVRPTYVPKLLAGAENERYGFAFVDPDLLCRYNAADTTTTAKVGGLLESWLAAEPAGMQNVAAKVVTPAGDAYARIESWGMGVDRGALEQFRAYLDLQLAEVAERFRPYGYSPEAPDTSKWNPNSNADVGRLLFTDLKLPSVRTTDSGADSTDADALEALADKHPAVRDLLTWRKLQKMRGTYAVGLAEHVRDDGRIHPSIHPDGARTGRTSSSSPNLQNVPSVEAKDPEQAKMARMLRDCFAPAPGHVLVEFDYSQLELRVAADLSGDPEMIAIFQRGEDYHLRTAKMLSQTLWNITPEEVTDVHRREVKACIAEGSLVLTSNGLKPIQAVALADLLWDGCEWVSHGGVVYQGTREVITHDGLTATPDHVVFTADGREVAFEVAAQEGCGLAITAAAGAPARYATAARRTVPRQVPLDDSRNVCRVPAQPTVERRQRTRRQDADLPVHDEPADTAERRNALRGPASENTCTAVQRDLAAHAESELRSVCGVRGAGNTHLVCEPCGVRELRSAGASAPDLQGRADRPSEQRRALRTGQPSDGRAAREPAEYSAQSALSLQGPAGIAVGLVAPTEDRSPDLRLDPAQDGSLSCSAGAGREHPCAEASQEVGARRVYDILNAGPRNRFTVSGRLVHNCNFALLYDDSPHGIAYRIGITPEKAEEIRDAIFGCFPQLARWIKERVRETAGTGYAWTWWGGHPARRRPLVAVAEDEKSPAYKTARRGSWNGPIQGTGNEYLVASAIEAVDWILGDGIPAKLLVTIHDSMLFEVRRDALGEVFERVPEIMCSHPTKNGVPLAADAKAGLTWGDMKKWKKGSPCPV